MNARTQADTMLEIVYAAYATHIKVVQSKAIVASGLSPDDFAKRHWDANMPGVQTLWTGLVKGLIGNVAIAQSKGLLPPLISATASEPLLPGLGAPLDPDTIPAGLARRLAAKFRGQGGSSHTGAASAAGEAPSPAIDLSPGLAIGRSTECDGPADSGSSDCGSSDSGGGGGD